EPRSRGENRKYLPPRLCASAMKIRSPLRKFTVRFGEAFLFPWIGRVRIAADFPEAEDVAIEKGNLPDKLRAFPGITLRKDHARRSAVIRRERLAVPSMRDQDVVVQAGGERIVRGITV